MHKSNMKDKRFRGKTGEEFDLAAIAMPNREELQNTIGKIIKEEFHRNPVDEIRVLEIGFGTGYTTKIILNSDDRIRIVGVDSEEEMFKQAKENLSKFIENKRVEMIKADALEFLKKQDSDSSDVFASALTLHNFERDCREKVIKECHRVLKQGGLFINADKYALDDEAEHKKTLKWQLQQFKEKFAQINRPDLIQEWTNHYLEDEKPETIMQQSESIKSMSKNGFKDVKIVFRKQMEAVLVARK